MSENLVITLKDVYEAVTEIKDKLAQDFSPLPAQVQDHEKRLRALESPVRTPLATWILVVVGGVGGLIGLLTLLVTLMRYIPDIP